MLQVDIWRNVFKAIINTMEKFSNMHIKARMIAETHTHIYTYTHTHTNTHIHMCVYYVT